MKEYKHSNFQTSIQGESKCKLVFFNIYRRRAYITGPVPFLRIRRKVTSRGTALWSHRHPTLFCLLWELIERGTLCAYENVCDQLLRIYYIFTMKEMFTSSRLYTEVRVEAVRTWMKAFWLKHHASLSFASKFKRWVSTSKTVIIACNARFNNTVLGIFLLGFDFLYYCFCFEFLYKKTLHIFYKILFLLSDYTCLLVHIWSYIIKIQTSLIYIMPIN